MDTKIIGRSIVAFCGILVLTVPLAATAVASDSSIRVDARGGDLPVDSFYESASDQQALLLPIVSEDMSRLASEVTARFAEDPQFASAEVTKDRERLIVHWHGDPSDSVLAVVGAEHDVTTVFEQTQYLPGDLRVAAGSLLATNSVVKAAGALYDGSGLRVSIDASVQDKGRSASSESLIKSTVPFPTTIDYDAPESSASTRQNDTNYHLGGARISLFEDPYVKQSCTTGFAVVKASDTTKQGMMFAAHCGAVGGQWITSDGLLAYNFGEVVVRDTRNDGAIIDSNWSQSYIWTADWDSSYYAKINGVASPYIGQELCYSGSYSGLICGNIVDTTNYSYSLETAEGDLTDLVGFRSVQAAGLPAVGNGDSGGPGYQIVQTPSGVKRWAVGIISAIPGNAPAECRGVAGDPAEGGRKCSPIAFASSVVMIGNQTGWYVPDS